MAQVIIEVVFTSLCCEAFALAVPSFGNALPWLAAPSPPLDLLRHHLLREAFADPPALPIFCLPVLFSLACIPLSDTFLIY